MGSKKGIFTLGRIHRSSTLNLMRKRYIEDSGAFGTAVLIEGHRADLLLPRDSSENASSIATGIYAEGLADEGCGKHGD